MKKKLLIIGLVIADIIIFLFFVYAIKCGVERYNDWKMESALFFFIFGLIDLICFLINLRNIIYFCKNE